MAVRFVSVDHDTPMLLPPDLRDWVPADHIVHFVMDAVKLLDLSSAKINHAIDGTKILANASKHGAVSHGHAIEQMKLLEDQIAEVMAWRTTTSAGKELYGLRKETVEPVFGIIKETLGFRRFHLRGLGKVDLEWTLVRLAYNIKRLYHISQSKQLAVA